ncbi:MAG: hypothetical protein AAF639_37290 [Chloroflexota bacterium]
MHLFNLSYRVRQFRQGIRAQVTALEYEHVAGFLEDASYQLFTQMPVDIQRHSLNVLYTLTEAERLPTLAEMASKASAKRVSATKVSAKQNDQNTALAMAALLHDVGKSETAKVGVTLNSWVRTGVVAGETLVPTLLTRIATDTPTPNDGVKGLANRVGYVCHVHLMHPAIGAQMAADAGCSQLVCWLIAHHQDKEGQVLSPAHGTDMRLAERYSLLRALQWADGQN